MKTIYIRTGPCPLSKRERQFQFGVRPVRLATLCAMPKPSTKSGASPLTPTVLLDALFRKAIPWADQNGMEHVVVARKAWREVVLPPEVRLSHKKLESRPTGTHGPRLAGSASATVTKWTKDDQEVRRVSMLACVVAGHTDFQIGNYVLHCPESTFIFIPAGVPHPTGWRSHLEGENRVSGSCDLLWFSPQGRHVQSWMCRSRGESHLLSRGHENIFPLNDQLVHFMNFMQEEALARHDGYERTFEGALRLFLFSMYREIKAGRFLQVGPASGDEPNDTLAYDPIDRAQEYVKSHLSANLTIDRVAYAVHMSRAQFTRRFHAQTGQTFIEYVNARRIEQAQTFLRETDWSVAAICGFVGFSSVPYFHALFRRLVGSPPLEFRRKCQLERPEDGDF